jgi:RND family efflux transporter MFP subunit
MKYPRALAPAAILAAGALGFALLYATRPRLEPEPPVVAPPLVRVVEVEPRTVQLFVRTHGTVVPRTESELVAQVSGEVVWVSPSLAPGAFFEPGEALVRIEPSDYDAAVQRARAARDRAAAALANTRRERDRQRRLSANAAASEARLDEAENAFLAADATLREAQVALETAERDRARTELHAAYAGRVREKRVDIGQFVTRGDTLADLYAIEYAEVPLPVADSELAFLDLHHPYRDPPQAASDAPGPAVTLRADFAGVHGEWTGRIVRTEAEIDPRSRTVTVVARVEDPYGRTPEGPPVPLPIGLFVEAEIHGRRVDDAAVLPTTALHDDDTVYVIDETDRLHVRQVEVVRALRDQVVIGAGLSAGERVCVSTLRGAIDGMQVRAIAESPPIGERVP